MDKQTKFVLQLLFATLATATLFLPWVTVMSARISLFDLQFGPVILVFIVFSSGLAVYGFAQSDPPVSPLIRASLWAASFAAAAGYAVYWLRVAEFRCAGIAIPLFLLSTLALLLLEVTAVQKDRLRLLGSFGGFGCLLVLVIGLATGQKALASANGQRIPPNAKDALSSAMKQLEALMPGPSSFGIPPSPAVTKLEPPKVRLTVTSWGEAYQLGRDYSMYRPETGKKFIVATVSVTNASGERLSVDSSDLELAGSDRNVYQASSFMGGTEGMGLLDAEVLPQGTASGNVVFEVDRSVQPVSVGYRPGLF